MGGFGAIALFRKYDLTFCKSVGVELSTNQNDRPAPVLSLLVPEDRAGSRSDRSTATNKNVITNPATIHANHHEHPSNSRSSY
jgi:hypothetical protein